METYHKYQQKPFLCHKCGKVAVHFGTNKQWHCKYNPSTQSGYCNG